MVVLDAANVERSRLQGSISCSCAVTMKKDEIKALEEALRQGRVPGRVQQQRPPFHP